MSDGWDGILEDGEFVIWQGKPDGKIAIQPASIGKILFGCIFTGFSIFWMTMAAQGPGIFWMFGLPFLATGIGMVLYPVFGEAYLRQHTFYTLTSRRAFVATDLPVRGKSLRSWPLEPDTALELIDGAPGTVYFARENRRTNEGTSVHRIGFERIENATDVFAKMRQVQTGQIAPPKDMT